MQCRLTPYIKQNVLGTVQDAEDFVMEPFSQRNTKPGTKFIQGSKRGDPWGIFREPVTFRQSSSPVIAGACIHFCNPHEYKLLNFVEGGYRKKIHVTRTKIGKRMGMEYLSI